MSNFSTLKYIDFETDTIKNQLSKYLVLINDSEFKEDLLNLFEFSIIEQELVDIVGINKLMLAIIKADEQYKKIDLKTHITNISCIPTNDEKKIRLHFKNLDEQKFGEKSIEAFPLYSSQKDFFESFYKIEKFANHCMSKGVKYFSILENTIDSLNKISKNNAEFEKSFRLLKNVENGNYFLRGITSTKKYRDYNIRFSLFVTIVTLHKVMKQKEISFSVSHCEYSESLIRAYFVKNNSTDIPNIGKLSFALEMSNDEIKREALKFSVILSLTLTEKQEDQQIRLYLKPNGLKNKLLSITHSCNPEKVVEHLALLSDQISLVEEEMINEIKEIYKIDLPDQLRHLLSGIIAKSRFPEIKQFKQTINETLSCEINRVAELLLLMNKVDRVIPDTYLELKEYLRYTFYEVLTKKKIK